MANRHLKFDLTRGPVFSTLLRFSLPIFAGSIVSQLYNVADSVVVGQFVNSDAIAAVAACAPVMTIMNMFMIGLSTGSNVVIAQRAGSGDKSALQKALNTVSLLTLVCSAIVTILGLALHKPLLTATGTPKDIFNDAQLYIVIIFIGTVGNMVYNMGSGVLRGMGDSSWPFLFLLLCSVLNVILDLVAVILLGWGVWGVALATTISQIISGIGIIIRINNGGYGIQLGIHGLRFDKFETRQIIGIGLPAGIQNIGNSLAAICVQAYVNGFGENFMAANSIVQKVDDFVNIPVMAISTALCTFVGQNMGTFNLDRIKKGINQSILFTVLLGVVLCGGQIALRNILPYAFTSERAVIDIASTGLFIMSFQCIFHGIDRCLVNAMRGAGKSVVPMITAQFGAFSRIPLSYFLAVYANDWLGIFLAMLIAALLRCIAIGVYYFCGGWKRAVERFRELHKTPAAENAKN